MSKTTPEKVWGDRAAKLLVGRKIVAARYMTPEDMDGLGWDRKALVLELDDGHLLFPSSDDEGNDAGALFTTYEECDTFPVI